MSMNGPVTISMALLNGAIAAVIGLSSPALARGGGHHHGECGEHGASHGCGYAEHEAHHHGYRGRQFEDHHQWGYPGGIGYPSYQKRSDDRGPPTSGSTPGSSQP